MKVTVMNQQYPLDVALTKSFFSASNPQEWIEAERLFIKDIILQIAKVSSRSEQPILRFLADSVPKMIYPVGEPIWRFDSNIDQYLPPASVLLYTS